MENHKGNSHSLIVERASLQNLNGEEEEIFLDFDAPSMTPLKTLREKTILELAEDLQEEVYRERETIRHTITIEERNRIGEEKAESECLGEEDQGASEVQSDCDEDCNQEQPIKESTPKAAINIPSMAARIEESKETMSKVNREESLARSQPISSLSAELKGVLKRKNPYGIWQSRFVRVKDCKLIYFRNGEKSKPMGCLNFNLHKFEIEARQMRAELFSNHCSSECKKNRIVPTGIKKAFIFKAPTHAEMKKWFEMIKREIERSFATKHAWRNMLRTPKFWKVDIQCFSLYSYQHDRISCGEFNKSADTGDLLLFRSKTFASRLQRTFTRSDYDHVAMLLRYSNGDIVLLEATGKIGVGICTWRYFLRQKWQNLYSRLVYRPLILKRDNSMIKDLEDFIKGVIGKKYKVSASKLLKKASLIDSEEKTFFCSELVAAAYKRLNLLPKDVSSCQYWPGTFSMEKNLRLLNGELGEEYLVDFAI